MQITLPEPIYQCAKRLAAEQGYVSVGDYVAELIQQKAEAAAEAPFQNRKTEIEEALLAGLASGESSPLERADWEELHRRVGEVHGQKSGSR